MSKHAKVLVRSLFVAVVVASLIMVLTEAWWAWRSPYAPEYFSDRILLLASPVVRTTALSCVEEDTRLPAGGHVSIEFRGKEKTLATLHWKGKSYILEKVPDSSVWPHYGENLSSFQFWQDGRIIHVTLGDSNFYQCM